MLLLVSVVSGFPPTSVSQRCFSNCDPVGKQDDQMQARILGVLLQFFHRPLV
jgi:hypothetical protein